jgi:acetylornithine deacetylase/succinyl-diaminopimelate desuccinylase-like protein
VSAVPTDLLEQAVADLRSLVAIPSVSATGDAGDDAVARSARAVRELAERAGAARSEVLDVPGGRPAVVASWPAPAGAPTVLLYAHHDVQPAGDLAAWESGPFTPVQRGGRLYGRGAADDKAGVVAHLAAVRAHGGAPPVGVTLFVEGEEEIGSPTFEEFLQTHRDRLRADVILVADSSNWTVDVPALTSTLRGIVICDVEVQTLQQPVHSGLAGGGVPDALMVLTRLLASLHLDDGSVAVPGLHTHRPPSLSYPASRFRAEVGVLPEVALLSEDELSARLWSAPAITVLGIDAPSVAEAAMVLSPVARARVSMRIAPGEDPQRAQRLLHEHLMGRAPWGARVSVTDGPVGPATLLTSSAPVVEVARQCLTDAFGQEPVDIGVGGSIPFITSLASAFPDAVVLVTGIGDPASSWHGPNESVHLETLGRVCSFEADLLGRLADTPEG